MTDVAIQEFLNAYDCHMWARVYDKDSKEPLEAQLAQSLFHIQGLITCKLKPVAEGSRRILDFLKALHQGDPHRKEDPLAVRQTKVLLRVQFLIEDLLRPVETEAYI